MFTLAVPSVPAGWAVAWGGIAKSVKPAIGILITCVDGVG